MWSKLFSSNIWKDWDFFGFFVWIMLSICLGLIFHYTMTSIVEWWNDRGGGKGH